MRMKLRLKEALVFAVSVWENMKSQILITNSSLLANALDPCNTFILTA
jgi:hypothetical protein